MSKQCTWVQTTIDGRNEVVCDEHDTLWVFDDYAKALRFAKAHDLSLHQEQS